LQHCGAAAAGAKHAIEGLSLLNLGSYIATMALAAMGNLDSANSGGKSWHGHNFC
jgi:hypothetical protein